MARIRTVKPEFWTAEQVMELSRDARLMFVGMWNFCDDKGVHPASVKTLKAEVFPSDDLLSSDVQRLVNELIAQGLLVEFEASERRWWYVTGWHHQVINRPSKSRFPEPPRTLAPLPSVAGQDEFDSVDDAHADGENGRFSERSVSAHGTLTDDSLSTHGRKGVGREGKGVNPLSVVAGSGEPTPLPPEQPPTDTRPFAPAEPTRKGRVCGLLRQAGMADAAPHYLTDETWAAILAKRTDEEIVEVAKAKMAARPGQRTGLKYIAPALMDDPEPIAANARASPRNGAATGRQARIDNYAAQAAEARGEHGRNTGGSAERDITGEATRIA